MSTIAYSLPNGQELRLLRGAFTAWGAWYSSILFAEDGTVINSTDSTRYMDYCAPEIALHELHRLDRPDSLQETFADWHPCECDDDDDK